MDQKISQLTAYTTPTATDVLPIVDVATGITKKIIYSDFLRIPKDTRYGIVAYKDLISSPSIQGIEQVSSVQTGDYAALRLITGAVGNNQYIAFGKYTDPTTYSEFARFSNAGYLGIGITNPTAKLQIESNSYEQSASFGMHVGSSAASPLSFRKSRGTLASPTIVQSGDDLGLINYGAYDGSTYAEAAAILASVDGTPGSGDMPGRLVFYTTPDGSITRTERMRITSAGNIKIAGTAVRGTTEGTNHLDIFDGTAPVGTLTNGISLYSASGELRVMDAAGNDTLLSPHEKGTNYWIYDSVDTTTGKHLRIDMERLMKKLDNMLGGGFIKEFYV